VKNAQNAGAIGVIIANNVAGGVIQMGGGDATITIPTLMISQADGTTLKGQLTSGLNATLLLDNTALGGADSQGRALMFAPNPFQSGSSVSHWDSSLFPNQLMEPAISGDLSHSVTTPEDLTFSLLLDIGWSPAATATPTPTPTPTVNPIDTTDFFVRQHYLDFLNRTADASGLAFWTNNIESCGSDTPCREVRRVDTSAGFFFSIEFQQTGNLVYKMYKAGLGNINPPTVPVPVRRANFIADKLQIQNTPVQVIVGQGNWQTQLESNKQAFALAFVQRSAFQSLHAGQNAADYVSSLFNRAGVTPTSADANAAVNAFNTAGGGDAGRAAALRSVADSNSVSTQLFNESFVLMQYFGYLQRDPDSGQDRDFSGYNFWLNKLNQFNGNYINAEMVKAFITSIEYRQRFGQ
jgi:hypothetical protein